MRKTKKKIRADIVAYADAREATRLAANDKCNAIINMAENNYKADIDSTNIDLIEFRVHTKTLLADSI